MNEKKFGFEIIDSGVYETTKMVVHPDLEWIYFGIFEDPMKLKCIPHKGNQSFMAHKMGTRSFTVTPGGDYIITGGISWYESGKKAKKNDPSIKIWDKKNLNLVKSLNGHRWTVHSLDITYDLKYLVSSGGRYDERLLLWDLDYEHVDQNTERFIELDETDKGFHCVSISPDGKYYGHEWGLFIREGKEKIKAFKGSARVNQFSSDGKFFVNGKEIVKLSNMEIFLSKIEFSTQHLKICPNGKFIVYVEETCSAPISIVDITTGNVVEKLDLSGIKEVMESYRNHFVQSMDISRDGRIHIALQNRVFVFTPKNELGYKGKLKGDQRKLKEDSEDGILAQLALIRESEEAIMYNNNVYYPQNKFGMQTLDLDFKDIVDMGKIRGLNTIKNLDKLDLSRNKITTIKGLESLTMLKELDLGNNQIQNINGLDNLTNLEELRLSGNNLESTKGLENLVNLKTLLLSAAKLKKLEGLQNLSNLITLKANNCEIEDMSGVSELVNLETLELSSNNISEIKGTERLSHLTRLNLNFNDEIREIKNLENCTELKSLDLNRNKIESTKGVENLTKLELLTLQWNKVKKIEGLEKLVNLKQLYLENGIEKIEGLDTLINLERLSLDKEIKEIEGLDKLTNLTYLNLGVNKIEEIKGLDNLRNLKKLDLMCNKIKELKGLDKLDIRKISQISLGNNLFDAEGIKISDAKEVIRFCREKKKHQKTKKKSS